METQIETIDDLEAYFGQFREHVIGVDATFDSPYGKMPIVYADWTASGRLYGPIEDKLKNQIGPFVANTHTETSTTGAVMTRAYKEACEIIKAHINATDGDALLNVGTGMTGAVNKFQRILGLKVAENLKEHTQVPEEKRPVVFVSHMEHHSNQTSWYETIAHVEVIPFDDGGLIDLNGLRTLLKKHAGRPLKIASVTACSNVTGIRTDYHAIAKVMHQHQGLCFIDFACSAPYVNINMHPSDKEAHLDAIFFSPHKFLGGPGASGVLVFNKKLYQNLVPDNPGGGTVKYTNPWGEHDYIDDVEIREDGGTPGFLQTIRTALAIRLKERMGVGNILKREHHLNSYVFDRLDAIANITLLAPQHRDRLGIFSFYIEGVHYNLLVKLLNDRYGVQTRGGCSCAGTYGHYLLNVDRTTSKDIERRILEGCLLDRPGWVRMSIHPTMTNQEVYYVCDAIEQVALNAEEWGKEYNYDPGRNAYIHTTLNNTGDGQGKDWFNL